MHRRTTVGRIRLAQSIFSKFNDLWLFLVKLIGSGLQIGSFFRDDSSVLYKH